LYDQVAIEKYQDNKLDDAIMYIDSAISLCPSLAADPYTYKVQAQILKSKFKESGNEEIRTRAVQAYAKLKKFDSTNAHTKHANINITYLAETLKKEASENLDTINYQKAFHKFMEHVSVMENNIDNYNKDKALVQFYGIYANLQNELYKNDNARIVNLDSAVYYYESALAIDSMDFDANNMLGIIYHNYALDLVFNQPEDIEVLELMVLQDQVIEYCLKSIPYLKKANFIKPNSLEPVRGLAQAFTQLYEHDQAEPYISKMKELTPDDGSEKVVPDGN
jgi:tetratricopeptide (TPR) repeat protein